MTTFTSTQDGNWDDDATWGLSDGDYPGNGHTDGTDRAVINHTVTNNGNHNIGSITINASKTLNGGGGNILYIHGDSNATSLENNGSVTNTPRIEFKNTGADKNAKFGTGTYGLVEVNCSGRTVTMTSAMTSSNNLTISAGTLSTGSNHALTVTGTTSITGTLICNTSAITLGNNVDDAYSVAVNGGGTFTGGNGTHILGAINVNSGATNFTFSSGNTTITGRATSGNSRRVFSTSATDRITAAGTLIIDQARTPLGIRCDDTTGINNLTMNCGTGRVLHIDNTLTVGGTLNVSAGTVTTRNVGDSVDNALTVGGQVSVTGTLTGNESAISMRNLVIAAAGTYSATNQTTTITGEDAAGNYAIDMAANGTFYHNGGTVRIEESNNTVIRGMEGDDVIGTGSNAFHKLEIAIGNGSQCHLTPAAGTSINIVNNVSIAEGILRVGSDAHTLTIGGNLDIESGGQFGLTTHTGAHEFGSLTIASGATFIATSGTTTITGKESGACFANSGTFTHNNGKVSFTKSGGTWTTISNSGGQSFYDVNVDSSTGAGIYTNDPLTILNNFTLVRGTFIANADGSHDGDITVHGLTSIGGGANATKLENDGRTLQLASVTVLSNGTIDVAEGTNNFGGIRNVGGTIS